MLTLSAVAFAHAAEWIRANGRPLEVALLERTFQGGSPDSVVDALRAYRNEDGGFGRALEPDIRAPGSSGLATSIALAHLADARCASGDPLVTGAMAWARSVFDRSTCTWPLLPDGSGEHPHAPWWHDEQGSVRRNFAGFRVVPRAKMLAALWYFRDVVPDVFLHPVTDDTVAAIESLAEEAFWVDAYAEAAELADAPGIRPEWRARLAARLIPLARAHVTRDPAQWSTYSTPPLRLAPAPRSLLAAAVADIVPDQLDYLITIQPDDGAWRPTWNWGDRYPEAWKVAEREWRGIVTLQTLLALNAYGRIDADD
jgi:hypothetical protein